MYVDLLSKVGALNGFQQFLSILHHSLARKKSLSLKHGVITKVYNNFLVQCITLLYLVLYVF